MKWIRTSNTQIILMNLLMILIFFIESAIIISESSSEYASPGISIASPASFFPLIIPTTFKKLEIEEEGSWIQRKLHNPHTKKTAIF